jgi:5-methylcytosine-specific restriction endonuclease McrA
MVIELPLRRCPHCRKLVADGDLKVHLQLHSDARRERKGSSGSWKTTRQRILFRDEFRCAQCQSTEELEVHHIDGNWRNDDPKNLVTLCATCHDHVA